jgi:hypothetical protein
MKGLVKYIEESFAIQLELKGLPKDKLGMLPLYLRGSYMFFDGYILNRHVIFIEPAGAEELTPDQKQKQVQTLKELFKLPVMFILNDLEPWERKRLIGKNVAFVQPGKPVRGKCTRAIKANIMINIYGPDVMCKWKSIPMIIKEITARLFLKTIE